MPIWDRGPNLYPLWFIQGALIADFYFFWNAFEDHTPGKIILGKLISDDVLIHVSMFVM